MCEHVLEYRSSCIKQSCQAINLFNHVNLAINLFNRSLTAVLMHILLHFQFVYVPFAGCPVAVELEC